MTLPEKSGNAACLKLLVWMAVLGWLLERETRPDTFEEAIAAATVDKMRSARGE